MIDGTAWIVGNGNSISIVDDRWVGGEKLESTTSILPEEWRGRRVSELIEKETGQWNRDLIEELFQPNEAMKILAMPRPLSQREDQRVWRFTKQGWFSVKSAYHRAVETLSPITERRTSTSIIQKGWAKIWEVQAIPRVRLLLWRACANALPVKENLCRRKCSDDPVCILCGEETESVAHLLMHCRQVQPIWYASGLRVDMKNRHFATFQEFLWSSMENSTPRYTSLLAYIIFEIWLHRNAVIFEGKKFGFQEVLQRATNRWNEDTQSRDEQKGKARVEDTPRWEKPQTGKLKLNVDIAVWPNERTGMGFVLRDDHGRVVLAGKTEQMVTGSTTMLEGMALRFALQEVKRYRFRPHHIECDNQTIVNKINGKGELDVYTMHLVQDIKELMASMECVDCHYISRKANQVAHYIAHGPDFISINHDPVHVASFINMDVIAG